MTIYRWLLRALPRDVRARHGAAMAEVFSQLDARAREHGRAARVQLWIAESRGLARFALRQRLSGLAHRLWPAGPAPRHPSGPGFASDLYWAARHLRSRGWSAVVMVLLLAIAMSANTLMFAVSDSIVFRRLPFPDPSSLVGLARPQEPLEGGASVSAAVLGEWRKQTDVFAGMETYLTKTLFVPHGGTHETLRVTDVTPGMLDLLGVKPKWGRGLGASDVSVAAGFVAVINETLARRHFGTAPAAVGATLPTTAGAISIVGVMPDAFHFPSGSSQLWRAMDPRGPLTRNFSGTFAVARLAPGVSLERAAAVVSERAPAVGVAAGRRTPYAATVAPLALARVSETDRRRYTMLMGAALCLLLIACANVTSIELAGALARARTSAVHLALGASRGVLARGALAEGLIVFALVAAVSIALTIVGLRLLTGLLPESLRLRSANPIDLDTRAFVFMIAATAVGWLVTMLPIVVRAYRSNLLALLRQEDRSATSSAAGTRVRRALTLVQVGLAVLLSAAALLWARSYATLLGIDKGFDSRNVASISYTLPPQFYPTMYEKRQLESALIEKLGAMPGVLSVAPGSPPTGALEVHGDVKMLVDDRPPDPSGIRLGIRYVDRRYFEVLAIPLLRGRMFEPSEPPGAAIVSRRFAARYWGGADPVGRTFRQSERHPVATVVGVAGDLVLRPPDMQNAPPVALHVYYPRPAIPPPAPATAVPGPLDSGGSFGFVSVMARFDSPARARQAARLAAAIEPRFSSEVELVDAQHAELFDEVRLVSRIVALFGAVALGVAMLGLYGVLALLVTARTREIGIRMALGATRADVRRLVLSSSFRLVLAGTALGLGGAVAVARASHAMLYGIQPWDPATLAAVTAIAVFTGWMATARPAQRASRVDPSTLLRS